MNNDSGVRRHCKLTCQTVSDLSATEQETEYGTLHYQFLWGTAAVHNWSGPEDSDTVTEETVEDAITCWNEGQVYSPLYKTPTSYSC